MGAIRGALFGGGIFFLYQWAKNNPNKKSYPDNSTAKERPKQNGPSNLDYHYKIVAEEIKNKEYESGLLARAIAEGGGDKEISRSIYIKLRVGQLNSQSNQRSNQEYIFNKSKNKASHNRILNSIGKYIYGLILTFLMLLIISTLLIFVSEPISSNSFISLLPLVLIVPLTIITYRKFRENSIFPKKPTPDSHVRCPDCRELVPKENGVCNHCGCKLIPQ